MPPSKTGHGHRDLAGVLFDKDGTLLDFDATWNDAYWTAAREVAAAGTAGSAPETLLAAGGMDLATGHVYPHGSLACGTVPEIAAQWATLAGLADPLALAARLEALFQMAVGAAPRPVPGLEASLACLGAAGLTLGVATMDSAAMAALHLEAMAIERHFVFVCGHDSGHGSKPDPGMVAAFCRHTGLAPAAVAMVGDTPHDLAMGRAAGVGLAVGVLTGSGRHADLKAHADLVLASVAELPAALGLAGAGPASQGP